MATDPAKYLAAPTMVAGCSCHEDGVVTEAVRLGDVPCKAEVEGGLGTCPCRCHMAEPPGFPCRFCGNPVPDDGEACPKCWVPATEEHLDALYREAWLGPEHRDGGA